MPGTIQNPKHRYYFDKSVAWEWFSQGSNPIPHTIQNKEIGSIEMESQQQAVNSIEWSQVSRLVFLYLLGLEPGKDWTPEQAFVELDQFAACYPNPVKGLSDVKIPSLNDPLNQDQVLESIPTGALTLIKARQQKQTALSCIVRKQGSVISSSIMYMNVESSEGNLPSSDQATDPRSIERLGTRCKIAIWIHPGWYQDLETEMTLEVSIPVMYFSDRRQRNIMQPKAGTNIYEKIMIKPLEASRTKRTVCCN